MKNSLLASITLFAISAIGAIQAQSTKDLYMPVEFRNAYAKETRSFDGVPGKNYFQNRCDYSIRAEFFPVTKLLAGNEIITYTNNSPDSLGRIRINLFQNLYKKGVVRDADTPPENIHDGVEVKSLKVNDQIIEPAAFRYYSTILVVALPVRIPPMSVTKIEIEWKQQMPVTVARRQGTYDKSNFFIAYWYPKICVFDDIDGWNAEGYQGNAEFYSEYGNFDVQVTAPADYQVWSSGELLNAADIFTGKYLSRLQQSSVSDSVIQIINETDRAENKITKPAEKHVWKYKTENQTDFAFAVSNTYVWDATSVMAGDKRIPISSVYSTQSKNFNKVAEISKKSIASFSAHTPGIPFPGKQLTVFQGGPGGMEFPCMINQQDYSSPEEMTMVTSHEIGHAYFPFNVGINEQKYGWMDEGLMTFIGFLAFSDLMGDTNLSFLNLLAAKYNESASSQAIDVPTMLVSYHLGDMTYGFITYLKSCSVFSLLYEYLGKEKFLKAIKEFSNAWAGKHPIPFDLFFAFNKVAGEDLAWFWKPWFFEFGTVDLGIGKVETGSREIMVNIEQKGSYPVPIVLSVKYKDGTEKTIKKAMDVWKTGLRSCKLNIPKGEIQEIFLNKGMMDTNPENNRYARE